MLTLLGSRYRNCDGFNRRNFLQLGAPLLGLGLADMFRVRASAADAGRRVGNQSVIWFWTHGGLSQQETYDMKTAAPAGYRCLYPIEGFVEYVEQGATVRSLYNGHVSPIGNRIIAQQIRAYLEELEIVPTNFSE